MAVCDCWTNNCTAACNYGSCAYHDCQNSCNGGCSGCSGCGSGCATGCSGCGSGCASTCKGNCKGDCNTTCTNSCDTLCNVNCSNSVAEDLANLTLERLITKQDMENIQNLLLQEASRRPSVSSLPNNPSFTGKATYASIEDLIENLASIGKNITTINISEAGNIILAVLGKEIIAQALEAAKETINLS